MLLDKLGEADLPGEVQRQLLIKKGIEKPGLIAAQQPVLRRGVAHALHDHGEHQALELPCRLLEPALRILLEAVLEIGGSLAIQNKTLFDVIGFHEPTSSNFQAKIKSLRDRHATPRQPSWPAESTVNPAGLPPRH